MVDNSVSHVEVEVRGSNGRGATAAERAAESVRRANEELTSRCSNAFELPIAVLVEQRDRLAQEHEALRDKAAADRKALVDEQDAFIADLMAEHDQRLVTLQQELTAAREQMSRQEALGAGRSSATATAAQPSALVDELEGQVRSLQGQLENAYRDVDDARTEGARLQEELDQTRNEANDVRLQMSEQVDAVRDDVFFLQRQIDEANRLVDDARDQGRDEAYRLNEQIAGLKRELDERREEVRRLRTRLADMDREGKHQSVPPPGPEEFARELEEARLEARVLRKQVIDAKRELSRKSRELEEARTSARRASVRSLSDPNFPRVTAEPASVRKAGDQADGAAASRPNEASAARRPDEPPPDGWS